MAGSTRGTTAWAWWIAGLVLVLAAIPAQAQPQSQDTCLKLVFGRFCLGGDTGSLQQEGPRPVIRLPDGERLALVFQDGPERIYVLAFRDRIYKVVRRYRGSSQLRFDDLYGVLREKYGPGDERSRFPSYADTPSRRLSSIRRGEGQAFYYWKPADSWHIELTWTREMGISLAYVATERDRQQQTAANSGL
jgi:hypothetical protein